MATLIQIIDKCIKAEQNPRMIKWTNAYNDMDSGYFFRLVSTVNGMVPMDIFSLCMRHSLYVKSVVDTGINFGFTDGERCVLVCSTSIVPDHLFIGRYNGKCVSKDAFVDREYPEEFSQYYDALNSQEFTVCEGTYELYEVQSPYGYSIDVPDKIMEPEFDDPDEKAPDAAAKFKPRDYNKKKQNALRIKEESTTRSQIPKKKRASRKGEVWWVKNLECSKDQVSSPYLKNRPIVIIQVVRGIVQYYRCTTNDIMYDYRKVVLTEPYEDGLTKDPVFVVLEEMELDERRLDRWCGYLTEKDMEVVFNPPDIPYWKQQFRSVYRPTLRSH